MYKILGADQKEYGPVSAQQIIQWINEGRANANTMARAEGTEPWLPLSSIPEFASLFAANLRPQHPQHLHLSVAQRRIPMPFRGTSSPAVAPWPQAIASAAVGIL